MFKKMTALLSFSLLVATSGTYTGGLSLSKIGSEQSSATAGVSNLANNRTHFITALLNF